MSSLRNVLLLSLIFAVKPTWGDSPAPMAPDPQAAKHAGSDHFGDALPEGALFRTGTVRARHDIRGGLVFSHDGQLLAAASNDGGIRLWRAATGELFSAFSNRGPGVRSLVFSSDSKTLVCGNEDRTISLWDVASGQERRRPTGHKSGVFSVALSPDGCWLVSCDVYDIRFWDMASGTQTRSIRMSTSQPPIINSFDLSPDGKTLAVCFHERPIGLWDVATLKELPQFQGSDTVGASPFFLPGGQRLLTLGMKDITLWEVATGKEILRFKGVRGYLGKGALSWEMMGAFAVSSDGRTLATGNGHFCSNYAPIHLWDLASGKEVRRLKGHLDAVSSLAFAPDCKILVSLGVDNTVRRWDLHTGWELDQPVGHQSAVTAAAFSPDGKFLASGSADRTVRVWDQLTGQEIRRFEAEHEIVRGLAFSTAGDMLIAWNEVLPAGERAGEFVTREQALTRIHLWEMGTGRERRHFDFRGDFIRCGSFSANSETLALGGEIVRIVNLATGERTSPFGEMASLGPNPADISALAFSPDGRLLAVDAAHSATLDPMRLSLLDVATRKKTWERRENARWLEEVACSPDGGLVATGGSQVHLWNARSGERIGALEGGTGLVVFSHDGKALATCSGGNSVVLWEVGTRKQRRRFLGLGGSRTSLVRPVFQYPVSCMAFSPDDRLFATGGGDTMVTVWDVTGRMLPGFADSKKLADLWAELADEDALKAFNAIWKLVSTPGPTLEFLKRRLPTVARADAERVTRLIADLDNNKFSVREKAVAELTTLGTVAAAGLHSCLRRSPSPEFRRRAENILSKIGEVPLTMTGRERIRAMRLVETLEQIGTSEAEGALRSLADWGPDEWFRSEASGSVERLSKRLRH